MRQLVAVIAVSLFLGLGCAPAGGPSTNEVDLEAERASLLEADRAMFEATSTSDTPVDTVMTHFTDDANVLAPGAPMARGKEQSREMFAALYGLPGFSLSWTASIAEVGGAADLGYTIGTYHMEFQDPEGRPVEVDGKFMTVWKRQPDNTWKVAVDMFNDNGAATTNG
jgi:ketosteroid isomerase-like protein